MPTIIARRATCLGAGLLALAAAPLAGAGTITAADLHQTDTLGAFALDDLVTAAPDNDNVGATEANRLAVSLGFTSPSPIDIVITVEDEGGAFPWATEYVIHEVVTNNSTDQWLGFHHMLGFGAGDDFVLAPINTVDFDSPHFDPAPTADPFGFMAFYQYSGSRMLHFWGGLDFDVAPRGQVTLTFRIDVPNSALVPAAYRTPTGFTFTLRQFPRVPPPPAPPGWYRGNTHTHSMHSFDGHDHPADLAAYYEALGYDFLVLTDHGTIPFTGGGWTDFSVHSTSNLLCISGEEMTTSTNHTNGVGTTEYIVPGTIAENVAAVRAQGGVPHLAHPVPTLGQTPEILAVPDLMHIEIRNAFFCCPHDYVNIWDQVLTAGKLVYGVASDDSHDMATQAGQAWIVVRADALDRASILAAMDAGDFYASTGITLADHVVDEQRMCVSSLNGERVVFVGSNGTVLQETAGAAAEYLFIGAEHYVRAEVHNAHGQSAWLQPHFVTPVCVGDINDDLVVNVADLVALIVAWGTGDEAADLDHSGEVDVLDLVMLILGWGTVCEGPAPG